MKLRIARTVYPPQPGDSTAPYAYKDELQFWNDSGYVEFDGKWEPVPIVVLTEEA